MLKTDLHLHSSFTMDAFNTAYELAFEAARKGVEMIGICDHGPANDVTPDIPNHFTIEHYCSSRRKRINVNGVDLIWGIEAEVIDEEGNLDPKITDGVLKKQDLVIASFHGKGLKPGIIKKEANPTKSIISAMNNCLIDIIGHPFISVKKEEDIREIVKAAVVQSMPLELNNAYLTNPKGTKKHFVLAVLMAKLLKEKGGKIFVGSDAHIAWELGGDEGIKAVLKEAKFDTKDIVNWTFKQANEFLAHRRRNAEN